MSDIANEYKEYYKELHKRGNFKGGSLKFNYADDIRAMVHKTRAKTVLDFGCGKAGHYFVKENPIHERFHVKFENISFYDPGVPEYEQLPEGTFDGVICTDVLEHIPEEAIDEVIETIFEKAEKFVFFVIHCGLANKIMPNGENAHVTIKRPEWWNSKLRQYYTTDNIVHVKYSVPSDPKLNILNL